MLAIEILAKDHDKNHKDSSHFLESVEEILEKVMEGYQLKKYEQTMIIYRATGPHGEGCEFHCYNAADGDTLAQTVVRFIDDLADYGYAWAATPYQHPKITELFKKYFAADRLTFTSIPTGILATVRI